MDRFDDDTLFAELRELRPTPRPEFTAELDERAAAGFPRRRSPYAAVSPWTRLADRWRSMSPRRRLVPVLAAAFAVLAVATAVVAIAQSGSSSPTIADSANRIIRAPLSEAEGGGGAEEVEETAGAEEEALEEEPAEEEAGGGGAGAALPKSHPGAVGARAHHPGEPVFEVEAPSVTSESAEAEAGSNVEAAPSGVAAGHRDIERSAYVVLGAKPGEVAGAAARVYEAVHAAHGVVLLSKVQSGSAGATGAYFELLIPSKKLDDTLATFSQIAEVRERHDATADITAPTVGAAEELRDSNASIEGLLKELGQVETEAERESVEARLREERRRHASIRARLDHLDKRASMSEVTVRIVSGHGAGVTPPSSDEGGWGVGDALHDAGHILTIAAGVLLIALAVLAPIALIALLVWAANRVRVRRLRERTLG